MFPLTRQSLITSFTFLLTTVCVCGGGLELFADDNIEKDTPEGGGKPVPVAAEQWQAPPWYMDEKEADRFERQKIKILQYLKQNNMNSGQRSEVYKVAHYYLSKMTHESVRPRIPKEVTTRLNTDILSSSNRPGNRAVLMDELIKEVPALLKHPSDLVRINAVMMLTELSIEPADFQTKTPALPYAPVHKILIQILEDSTQLTECRVIAARGLGRVCRDSENNSLSSTDCSDIAISLSKTLKSVPTGAAAEVWWFRYRMVEAMGFIDRLGDINNNPVVIDGILEVLANPEEQLIVRSQAALSISRLPYVSSTNVQLITHEICQLSLRLCAEFKKDRTSPKRPEWRTYFSRVYVSFRPEFQSEADDNWGLLYQVRRGGLGGNANYVNDAFSKAMPVYKSILESPEPGPIPDAALKDFANWVKSNKPTNRKVTPQSQPLPE